jgi:hypothetical protein
LPDRAPDLGAVAVLRCIDDGLPVLADPVPKSGILDLLHLYNLSSAVSMQLVSLKKNIPNRIRNMAESLAFYFGSVRK